MGRTNGDERAAQPSTTPEDERARARRQRKKGSPVVLDDEVDDLTWFCDGSLSALNERHRKLGLWAFDTCNADVWAGAKEDLARSKSDLVAV